MTENKRLRFRIIPAENGKTLRGVLRKRLPDKNGEEVLQLIRAGGVYVNNLRVRVHGVRVAEGERITVHLGALTAERLAPEELQIVERGDDFMIIDKPSHVPTRATVEVAQGTISQAVVDLMRSEGTTRPFVGIVHDLDVDHSGLVLLTTRSATQPSLHNLFLDMQLRRSYQLCGPLPDEHPLQQPGATFDCRAEVVARRGGQLRLARSEESCAVPVPAHTRFTHVRKLADGRCLLSAEIVDGRSPQLQLHLRAMGFASQDFEIHAESLSFAHPATHQKIEARSPGPSWGKDS